MSEWKIYPISDATSDNNDLEVVTIGPGSTVRIITEEEYLAECYWRGYMRLYNEGWFK